MDQEVEVLEWNTDRRFGVEIEVNAFDGRSRPVDRNHLPAGIDEVGNIIVEQLHHAVKITKWGHTHNNRGYIVKPDGSCGMEVCTPVSKGWYGLQDVCRMAQVFAASEKIKADDRCSLHVHVNVHDCSKTEVGTVGAWWVKCEPVFIDSMPGRRKRSRYCQPIGMSDMFEYSEKLEPKEILDRLSEAKYFTLNDYHYNQKDPGKQRDTIEFRLAENDACTDPFYIKNWVRLVVHFVDCAKKKGFPASYKAGSNPPSGLCWWDPIHVFEFLEFMPGQRRLSGGLQQTRNWFLARLHKNIFDSKLTGIWSKLGRSVAYQEVQEIISLVNRESGFDVQECLYPSNLEEALYGEKYQV